MQLQNDCQNNWLGKVFLVPCAWVTSPLVVPGEDQISHLDEFDLAEGNTLLQ